LKESTPFNLVLINRLDSEKKPGSFLLGDTNRDKRQSAWSDRGYLFHVPSTHSLGRI